MFLWLFVELSKYVCIEKTTKNSYFNTFKYKHLFVGIFGMLNEFKITLQIFVNEFEKYKRNILQVFYC